MKIDTGFEIGQRVMIKDLRLPGHIDTIQIDRTGLVYKVVYFTNCEQRSAWMVAEDIEAS